METIREQTKIANIPILPKAHRGKAVVQMPRRAGRKSLPKLFPN